MFKLFKTVVVGGKVLEDGTEIEDLKTVVALVKAMTGGKELTFAIEKDGLMAVVVDGKKTLLRVKM